jgi:KDEL-tailed cysteine endopeptidase
MFSKFFILITLFTYKVNGLLRGGDFSNELMFSEKETTKENDNDKSDYHWKQFTIFQRKFNKFYDNIQDLETRFDIFKYNLNNIITHNLDTNKTFSMSVNQFSDLTPEEFKSNFVLGIQNSKPVTSYGCKSFSGSASGAPSSIDWRSKNAVTSVKDQGQCGSCWTFSATGAIEGAWAISKGQLVDLSEQELVDCATGISYGSHGCSGGQMDGAFKFVIQNGQCSYTSYPYTSGTSKTSGTCQKCEPVAFMSQCSDVKPSDQISLKAAVAKQPVAVAIEADTFYFQSYSSGILTDAIKCGTKLDHGVLVVGYGEENGMKYWLVKNSWGTTWGENGYVKIGRSDSTNDDGVCGIALEPSFPNV